MAKEKEKPLSSWVFENLIVVCKHCKKSKMNHADGIGCLFQSTRFEPTDYEEGYFERKIQADQARQEEAWKKRDQAK